MSIFANNVNKEAPSNISWDKVAYDEWVDIRTRGYTDDEYTAYGARGRFWYSIVQSIATTKNELKRSYQNRKRVDEYMKKELDCVIQRIYSKYGVWLKYRVQMGPNKRIKSIYFVKFC